MVLIKIHPPATGLFKTTPCPSRLTLIESSVLTTDILGTKKEHYINPLKVIISRIRDGWRVIGSSLASVISATNENDYHERRIKYLYTFGKNFRRKYWQEFGLGWCEHAVLRLCGRGKGVNAKARVLHDDQDFRRNGIKINFPRCVLSFSPSRLFGCLAFLGVSGEMPEEGRCLECLNFPSFFQLPGNSDDIWCRAFYYF